MKLFQIEEPDGSPGDPEAPGAAVGIDASGKLAAVAISVGGNATTLADRDGFERDLPVPAADGGWQALLEGAKLRAERSLSRPVTHAVLVLGGAPDRAVAARLLTASAAAGLELLRLMPASEVPAGETPAEAAAIVAEDLAPRPEAPLGQP
jgi:hypothetical protein